MAIFYRRINADVPGDGFVIRHEENIEAWRSDWEKGRVETMTQEEFLSIMFAMIRFDIPVREERNGKK